MDRRKFLQLMGAAGLAMQPFGNAPLWSATDGIASSSKILVCMFTQVGPTTTRTRRVPGQLRIGVVMPMG